MKVEAVPSVLVLDEATLLISAISYSYGRKLGKILNACSDSTRAVERVLYLPGGDFPIVAVEAAHVRSTSGCRPQ